MPADGIKFAPVWALTFRRTTNERRTQYGRLLLNMAGTEEAKSDPALGNLADFAKAIPAGVAVLVLFSLIYEASFLYPLGLGFLSYYTWQDFLHRAVVWLPLFVFCKRTDCGSGHQVPAL
jgi:hypothetical protein